MLPLPQPRHNERRPSHSSPTSPLLAGPPSAHALPVHRSKSPPRASGPAIGGAAGSTPAATRALLPKLAMKRVRRMLRGALAVLAAAAVALHVYADHFGGSAPADGALTDPGPPTKVRVGDPHAEGGGELQLLGVGHGQRRDMRREGVDAGAGQAGNPPPGRRLGKERKAPRRRGGAGARAAKRRKPDYVDDEEIEAEMLGSEAASPEVVLGVPEDQAPKAAGGAAADAAKDGKGGPGEAIKPAGGGDTTPADPQSPPAPAPAGDDNRSGGVADSGASAGGLGIA